MQYSQGSLGRVFTLRLKDGERVPDIIESFAREHGVKSGLCLMIGGVGRGNIVVGPREADAPVIDPMLHAIAAPHEVAAVGTLFPGEDGAPVLHMHAALGREGHTATGCIRPGLDVWLVGEVVIIEIIGTDMLRRKDPRSGLALLARR
ncbi:MAG: PPC domain-containing DNA-binding protein [Pseudomonadota bacterium]